MANTRARLLTALWALTLVPACASSGGGFPPTGVGGATEPRVSSASPAVGMASFYSRSFEGRRTASGQAYDRHRLTAAHPSFPFGTLVRVTNLDNGLSVVVKVNDRGPFTKRRVIDVSERAARELGFYRAGTARVRVEELAASE